MRKARVFDTSVKGVVPRMAWGAKNLYNLIQRSSNPTYNNALNFNNTALTMYQQRWRAKRFLRGYHGDWIPERRFKRWFLPDRLPSFDQRASQARGLRASAGGRSLTGAGRLPLGGRSRILSRLSGAGEVEKGAEHRLPTASLFMRDVERRLDVAVFRCCFARSAYAARAAVIHGHVKLNGVRVSDPNTLLQPGDLITVDPKTIPMLDPKAAQKAARIAELSKQKDEVRRRRQLEKLAKERGQPGNKKEEATQAQSSAGGEAANASDSRPAGEAVPEKPSASKPKKAETLAPGVLAFSLPAYSSPFLFVPPYLEVSFSTCSAVYLRHPTIVAAPQESELQARSRGPASQLPYRSDIPSPYPAGGDIYSMAWEHYARDAPRARGDIRRLKVEAEVGRKGFESARAKDAYKTLRAIRRGKTNLTKATKQLVAVRRPQPTRASTAAL